jgi:hypothetical protein
MDIHQIQVKYDPLADRLLLQIRTRDDSLFPIWLTRRMVMRLWPHFRGMVSGLAVTRSAPSAMAVPEARDMLADAARERALQSADFKTQFDASSAKQPLGPEPVLPAAIDLRPAKGQAVVLVIRDADGRSLELAFGEDLAHGLSRLVESALVASEWGLVAAAVETQAEPGKPPARVLN